MMELQTPEKACPAPVSFQERFGSIIFLAILFWLGFVCQFIFAPLMPTIEQELGISHSQAGSLFLIMSLGFALAQLSSGIIASKLTHRGTLVASALAVGIVMLVFSLTTTLWAVRITMFLLGAAAAPHMPSALASITAMVNREDWGKALSVHQTAPSLAMVLAPLISILLLGLFSWRMSLASLGILAVIIAFAFIRFGNGGEFPGDPPRPAVVKAIMGVRSYWILIILFALSMGASSGIYTMLPLYLVTECGLGNDVANTILSTSRISGLFMAFVGGWLADKLGEKRVIAATLILVGISTILMGKLSGTWLIIIIFVQAALTACYFPAGFAALSRIVDPNIRSVATSLTTPPAFLIGNGVLPAFIGYMGNNYSFSMGITIAGYMMIIGSVLVIFLKLLENTEEGC